MLVIGILSLFSAIVLSIVSAIFSITGLQTIFSGAVIGVTIMGASMEFAKVSATLWLYSNWERYKRLLRTYFIIAILILIVISTIGIFGYLSKAYVGQETTIQQYDNKIEHIEESISQEQREIDRAKRDIEILNKALEQYIKLDVITRALNKREEQKEERKELRNTIRTAEDNIAEYKDKFYKLKNQKENFQINVGPIKYLAILLYGEQNARDFYDNAARIFIILLVVVFDPFAVLLIVAGNISINNYKDKEKQTKSKKRETFNEETKEVIEEVRKDINDKTQQDTTEIELPSTIPEVQNKEEEPDIDYEDTLVDYKGEIPERIEKKDKYKVRKKKRPKA